MLDAKINFVILSILMTIWNCACMSNTLDNKMNKQQQNDNQSSGQNSSTNQTTESKCTISVTKQCKSLKNFTCNYMLIDFDKIDVSTYYLIPISNKTNLAVFNGDYTNIIFSDFLAFPLKTEDVSLNCLRGRLTKTDSSLYLLEADYNLHEKLLIIPSANSPISGKLGLLNCWWPDGDNKSSVWNKIDLINVTNKLCEEKDWFFSKHNDTCYLQQSYKSSPHDYVGLKLFVIELPFAIHLIAFLRRKDLRNLPGKILASFCISRFMAHFFMGLNYFAVADFCYMTELFSSYFFLCSCCWCFVIQYHVSRTLHKSITLEPNSSKSLFINYLLLCLSCPFLSIVPLMMSGNDYCNCFQLVGRSWRAWSFVAVPNGFMILATVPLFIHCTNLIYCRKSEPQQPLWFKYRNRFLLRYCILTLLIMISNIFAIISDKLYTDKQLVYYFMGNSCVIGIYINVAFTFRRKVYVAYKDYRARLSGLSRRCDIQGIEKDNVRTTSVVNKPFE